MSDCQRCGGSGGGPDAALRCPVCHGTGEDPVDRYDEDDRIDAMRDREDELCEEWEDLL